MQDNTDTDQYTGPDEHLGGLLDPLMESRAKSPDRTLLRRSAGETEPATTLSQDSDGKDNPLAKELDVLLHKQDTHSRDPFCGLGVLESSAEGTAREGFVEQLAHYPPHRYAIGKGRSRYPDGLPEAVYLLRWSDTASWSYRTHSDLIRSANACMATRYSAYRSW